MGCKVARMGVGLFMDASLAGALVKVTVGGLSVDTCFIERDPVLELMGGFLAVQVCLNWLDRTTVCG
jgi:hypothetical protein